MERADSEVAREVRRRIDHRRRHAGHRITVRSNDGGHYCVSCARGDFDLDEAAIVRAMAGDPPEGMTPAERRAAAARLTAAGLSAREIAKLLKVERRSVVRYRQIAREMEMTQQHAARDDR